MNDHQILDLSTDFENWAGDLAGAVPAALSDARTSGLPPALAHLKVRIGVLRWPDGEEKHFHAALSESLLHIFRRGGEVLEEEILPPPGEHPLDSLRYLEHSHHWSDPVQDLNQPLWLALVSGVTRHFGIEYRLVLRINTRWGISPSTTPTPRELLSAFGFDPAEFSLYYVNSAQPCLRTRQFTCTVESVSRPRRTVATELPPNRD
jgi:hypothetical protein